MLKHKAVTKPVLSLFSRYIRNPLPLQSTRQHHKRLAYSLVQRTDNMEMCEMNFFKGK